MMIAKPGRQNQTKHSGFTEFYRDTAGKLGRQILPEAKKLPLFDKTLANSAKNT
jgi:hypothetical protein